MLMARVVSSRKLLPFEVGCSSLKKERYMASKEIYYTDGSGTVLNSYLSKTQLEGYESTSSTTITQPLDKLDIAQSHHFTITLQGFTHYRAPGKSFGNFLPVKNISLDYTRYENLSIPVAIFGNFPILNKKGMTSINLTCYDMDDNRLERELSGWEASCFPKNKFVGYMSQIARELIYTGYNVKGKKTLEKRMFVIPAGGVMVSRDYAANDAKMVNFSVIAVGNGTDSSAGARGETVEPQGKEFIKEEEGVLPPMSETKIIGIVNDIV